MSGIRINKTLILLFLVSSFILAQESDNKKYDDAKEEDILFGLISEDDFQDKDFSFWYNPEYEEYTVDSLTIANIKEELTDVKIVLVMGTWCHDSHREVPRFIKILKYADYDFSNLTIYAVDGEKEAGIEGFHKYDIKFVPTFIIYNQETEIGRIIEAPENTLEEDLASILLSNLK